MSIPRSSHVPREKYNEMKRKGTQQYKKCEKLRDNVNELTQQNDELTSLNTKLTKQLEKATNKLEEMSTQFENEKTDSNIPDKDLIDELEIENKSLRKEIRVLRKNVKVIDDKHREKVIQFERDLFVKDGKIQRLEDAKKDLKERYIELKEDLREERRNYSNYRKETK